MTTDKKSNAVHTSDFPTRDDTKQRLHKVLAHAGVASRRACEELISQGRVSVNRHVVTQLGTRVDPVHDIIHVDGTRIITSADTVTYLVNKPVGIVSTMEDPQGRPCLGDLAQIIGQRLFHIGRLDEQTSGLILLSNDGELAHRVMHPSYELVKTYVAVVTGRFTGRDARILCEGVTLDDGYAQADSVRIKDYRQGRTRIEIDVHIGRNRIVRRMCDAVDHPIIHLARTRLGSLTLGDLRVGEFRQLSTEEIQELYRLVDL